MKSSRRQRSDRSRCIGSLDVALSVQRNVYENYSSRNAGGRKLNVGCGNYFRGLECSLTECRNGTTKQNCSEREMVIRYRLF
jgi:hypothetical protein